MLVGCRARFFLTTTLILRAVGNHLGKPKMARQQVKASNLSDIMVVEVACIFICLAIYLVASTKTNRCLRM